MTRRSPVRYDQHNDFYQILGVPAWATAEDIQRVFRQRAKEIHPDRNPHNVDWATQQFKRLSEAYAVLGDNERREEYDRQRRRYHADEKPRPTSATRSGPTATTSGARTSADKRGDEWWNRPHPRQGETPPSEPPRSQAQTQARTPPRPSAASSFSNRSTPPSWSASRRPASANRSPLALVRDVAASLEILLRGPYRYVLFAAAAVLLANAVFIASTQGRVEEFSADATRTAQAATPVFQAFFPPESPAQATLPPPACSEDVNITIPHNGDELNFESFDIEGTARGEKFRAYTLTIEPVTPPGQNTPAPAWWTLSPEVRSPVTSGVLVAGASIRNVSEGYYRLRLTVLRSDDVPMPSCEIIIRRKR
ncbi:MAG: DnaJ domain-containing protein [Anaerolineae bacterium]|nr:DnaJ domain-containing protein [Anaerolineae bacterium]